MAIGFANIMRIINAHKIKFEDQFFTKTYDDICCLAAPLKKYGIEHFSYQVIHDHHAFEILTTHPQFSQLFIDEKFYTFALAGKPKEYSDGFVLGEDLGQPKILQAMSQSVRIVTGIAIVKTSFQKVEIFYFGSPASSNHTQSFYVNHLSMLERFIQYFKEAAKQLLINSSETRLYYPGSVDKTVLTSLEWRKNNLLLDAQECSCDFNSDDSLRPNLTPVECCVIEKLKEGLSTKEIAIRLSRSPRTIEKHVEHVKEKFGCKTKYQLLSVLLNIDE